MISATKVDGCKRLCHIYDISILWISAHTVFFILHEQQGLQEDDVLSVQILVDAIKVIYTNKTQFTRVI